jgi:hypothetical protein
MIRPLKRLQKRLMTYEHIRYLVLGRRIIFSITLLFSLASLIYFMFQKEEYLSESEFIPPNLQRLPVQAGATVIPGSAEDIAQVIAYLTSEQTRQKLVRLFRLPERYDIQAKSPRARAKKIKSLIERNIRIFRTKEQTIRIRVYDLSPDTAYMINQFLIQEAEDFCRSIAKYQDYYDNSVASLDSLRAEILDLETKLSEFRFTYKVFTLSDAQEAPTQTAIQLMLRNPEALRQYDKVVSMETRLRRFQELYTRLYERTEGARLLLSTYPTPLIIVNPPYKTDYVERPRILRNTAIAGAIGLAFSVLVVIYLGMLGFFEEDFEEAEERELIAEKA